MRLVPEVKPVTLLRVLAPLAVNAALAYGIWQAWTASPLPPPAISGGGAVQLPSLDSGKSDAQDTVPGPAAILARPVFSQSRRPFQPPAPQAPPPPPPAPVIEQPPPNVVVNGILLNGAVRKVHWQMPGSPTGEWSLVGDDIAGWKITAITPSGVNLALNGKEISVKLYPGAGPP